MTIYTPRLDSGKTGADCTGSNGAQNRTYTLDFANSITAQMSIWVDGSPYQYGQHYTKSGDVITFLNNVWDDMPITITYLTQDTGATSSGTLRYTTVLGLVKHIEMLNTVPNKDSNGLELIGTGDSSTTTFWLDMLGVIEDEYTLYYGSSEAVALTQPLTEDTHYSLDLDTNEITLTTAGVTLIGTNKLYGKYKYNCGNLLNSELRRALSSAERDFEKAVEVVFADYTDNTPDYVKVLNEIKYCELYDRYHAKDKVIEVSKPPMVNLSTTVASDYTTGGTEITLTSGTGFPTSGAVIYIGGNKVTYTSRTNDVLTVPATTPSIDSGAKVSSVVIELSREPEGSEPSWSVIDPDTEYQVDYDNGDFKILSNAFYGEVTAQDGIYPSNILIRVTYMHAWHDFGCNPTIPDDVIEVCYMMAAKKLVQRMIKKSHIGASSNFNPEALNSGDAHILQKIEDYKTLNVSKSVYDSARLS